MGAHQDVAGAAEGCRASCPHDWLETRRTFGKRGIGTVNVGLGPLCRPLMPLKLMRDLIDFSRLTPAPITPRVPKSCNTLTEAKSGRRFHIGPYPKPIVHRRSSHCTWIRISLATFRSSDFTLWLLVIVFRAVGLQLHGNHGVRLHALPDYHIISQRILSSSQRSFHPGWHSIVIIRYHNGRAGPPY